MKQKEKDMVYEAKYSLFDLNKVYELLSPYKSDSEIFRSFLLKLETVYYFTKFIDCNPFGGFKRSDYKHSVWGYNCYYFYWKKTFNHCGKDYCLALDVWLDEGENECERNLYFCLHIISKLNGDWVEKSEIKIDKTSGIKRIDPKNKSYTLKRGYVYDYYEKKVPVEGENESDLQSKLNEGMKSEIENLFSN